MSKNQTKSNSQSADTKPKRLGRGLSALLGEPVAIHLPPPGETSAANAAAPSAPSSTPAPHIEVKPRPLATVAASAPTWSNPGADQASSVAHAPTRASSVATRDEHGQVVMIDVDSIEAGRFQPRKTFDEAQLNELAASIKSAGVVQPILVRPKQAGAAYGYELIAGERRWRASKIAGLKVVPAIVSMLSDEKAAEWGLIENLQRSDLNTMERAWAIRGLGEKFGLSHAQIGEKLGIDRSSVANLVRLTDLEPPVRELLESGVLSAGHGKVLLGASAGPARAALAKACAGQGWSVRRLEQAITRANEPSSPAGNTEIKVSESALAKAAALRDLEKQLSDHLNTSVRVRASAGGKRGSLVVKFFDLDHFDSLMHKIGFTLK
jgi:ParB family chromosome partitioning protein